MNRCAICGARITDPEPFILFHSAATDEDVVACDACEEQVEVLLRGQSKAAVNKAKRYFASFDSQIKNRAVKKYLRGLMDTDAENPDRGSESAARDGAFAARVKGSFFVSDDESDEGAFVKEPKKPEVQYSSGSSGWIRILRTTVMLVLVLGMLGGIISGVGLMENAPGIGLLVIILTIPIALVSASGIMVFLDMAEDIRAIRDKLEGQ